MATVESILPLEGLYWSDGRIARELGVNRENVGRYVRLEAARTGSIGPPADCDPLIGGNPPARSSRPQSRCEVLREVIVAALRRGTPLTYRRMEYAPGDEAQVDFGTGAPIVVPEGQQLPIGVKTRRRRTHVLRVVFSHSRKDYSEVILR